MNRAAAIFEQLEIVIADNPQKSYLFSADERFEMITTMVADYPNVQVTIWRGLIVDFAEKIDAKVILRGVRALSDFDYEFELSMMNRALNPKIETLFMTTDQKYFVLRSSGIKEVAMFRRGYLGNGASDRQGEAVGPDQAAGQRPPVESGRPWT